MGKGRSRGTAMATHGAQQPSSDPPVPNTSIERSATQPFRSGGKRQNEMGSGDEAKRLRVRQPDFAAVAEGPAPRTPSAPRQLAHAPDTTPAALVAPRSGLSLEEILAENERLRSENSKLRQTCVASPESAPSVAEAVEVGVAEARAATATLVPRSGGRPFNIRTWTGDLEEQRQRRSQTDAEEKAVAMVELGEEASGGQNDNTNASLVIADDVAGKRLTAVAEEIQQCMGHSWIPQHAIASAHAERWPDDYSELRTLMEGSLQELAMGESDAAFTKFEQAFVQHLVRHDRPHLAFSAALLPYCGALRGRLHACAEGVTGAADLGDSLVELEALGRAITGCSTLLRRLLPKAVFGDRPPKRPKSMARVAYVRELAAQVGLSLDLVRLTCADRRIQRSRRHVAGQGRGDSDSVPIADLSAGIVPLTREHLESHTKQQEVQARLAGEDDTVRDLLKRQAVSGRSEREFHLKRAGHYLAALQMELELLHDEAVDALSVTELPGAANNEHILAVPIVERGALGIERDAHHAVTSPAATAAEKPAESAITSAPVAVPPEGAAATTVVKQPGEVDPVVTPTFGQFVDLHVLPLYIADVPFADLKILLGHYCGLYLDSDDEDTTWKRLRTPRPLSKSAKNAPPSRRTSRQSQPSQKAAGLMAGSAENLVVSSSPSQVIGDSSVVIGDASTGRDVSTEALELVGSEAGVAPTKLRAQMLYSVVEKRRHSLRAPGDMAAPRSKGRGSIGTAARTTALFTGQGHSLRRSSTAGSQTAASVASVTAPATPRVSLALQQPSTPIARKAARTPVTLRRPTKHDESHCLFSPVATTMAPDWALMETPKAKRSLG